MRGEDAEFQHPWRQIASGCELQPVPHLVQLPVCFEFSPTEPERCCTFTTAASSLYLTGDLLSPNQLPNP